MHVRLYALAPCRPKGWKKPGMHQQRVRSSPIVFELVSVQP